MVVSVVAVASVVAAGDSVEAVASVVALVSVVALASVTSVPSARAIAESTGEKTNTLAIMPAIASSFTLLRKYFDISYSLTRVFQENNCFSFFEHVSTD